MNRNRRACGHDQAAICRTCESRNGALDFVSVAHVNGSHFQPTQLRRGLDGAELSAPSGISGVLKNGYSRQARCDLVEQLQPFPAQTEFEVHKAGGVAPWPG